MSEATIHFGTSSWQHGQWRGSFYPSDIHENDWLTHYSQSFGCVEIRESFYRLPERHMFSSWLEKTPDRFRFAVQAPRTITHYKKLKNCENQVNTLFTRLRGLGPKIGPILFQLPSRWRCNLRRLEAFIARLPDDFRYAFEFHDNSWHCEEAYKLLSTRNLALCICDEEDSNPRLKITADIVYLRLHTPKDSPTGSYHPQRLRGWAGRARGWTRKGKEVYVFFDGEDPNSMLKNAQRSKKYMIPS